MVGILTDAQAASTFNTIYMIGLFIFMGLFIYFGMIRPQKKEQSKREAMYSAMAVGDIVVTTSGFYGEIIDITDDAVIVEFGNNRNCRI